MKQLALLTFIFALVVVVLGAYVRLSDAGLGCPDWPGCYGNFLVPAHELEIDQANQIFAKRPLEKDKAWKEMLHRYIAGILGLCVFSLIVLAWRRRKVAEQPLLLLALLVGMIVFQVMLGMWTVTLLLKPLVVTAHLLGGMTVLLLLWWLYLSLSDRLPISTSNHRLFPLILLSIVILSIQIALGGWTSANYSALVCPDFPTCQGKWLPQMDLKEGFKLWRGTGKDYEFGVLDKTARTAIHVAHRVGALVTVLLLLVVAIAALRSKEKRLQRPGIFVIVFVLLQTALGIMNVLYILPLPLAVAHNGVAALLLISVGTLLYHASLSSRNNT